MADLQSAQLGGLLKRIYADTYVSLIPSVAKIFKSLKFQKNTKLGDTFEQMVALTFSNGTTYGGSAGDSFTLADANPFQTGRAFVKGSEFVHREIVAIGQIKRASGTKEAFVNLWNLVYKTMMDSLLKRAEIAFMYGGVIGTGVGSSAGIMTAASSTNISATSTNILGTTSFWSTGILSGMEQALISFYTNNTTLVSSAGDSIFTITGMNPDTRVLTVTGTATGITALDAAILANANNVNAYFVGSASGVPLSSFGNEPTGLRQILGNVGTIFGINAATYSMWKGNTFDSGLSALTMGKVTSAVNKAVQRGLVGDVKVFLSPITWNNLNVDEAANRMYDSSYSAAKAEVGVNSIVYHSTNGAITFEPHNYMKEGEGFMTYMIEDPTCWRRVGSTEITNVIEGTNELVLLQANRNAFETRLYLDQAPFTPYPPYNTLITNIVNT